MVARGTGKCEERKAQISWGEGGERGGVSVGIRGVEGVTCIHVHLNLLFRGFCVQYII